MTLASVRNVPLATAATLACILGHALSDAFARPAEKILLAEDVHKNIQVLKGIPENEFMETMAFFSASLGVNCDYCHVPESGGSWEKYADDNAHKRTARKMIQMMAAINQSNFHGERLVTCYSCHRGEMRPRVTPSLAELYGPPPAQEPDEISEQAPGAPSVDQILDKYIRALGGAERLAGLTSFVAKGNFDAYSISEKGTAEIFAKVPDQRTVITHTASGDTTTTFDGRAGWVAAPATLTPVPVLALTGGDLDAARLDADLLFSARLKQALVEWRVGVPATVDDRQVQVVQGTSSARLPVKLYFDSESGLLVRLVRYTDSPVGLNPTQIDYADYREVAGVKMPFRWTVTWLDGRSSFELLKVQPNAPIDASRFAKPAPPPPPPRPAMP
jgi:outer membrane lipoprotein-sorting protein